MKVKKIWRFFIQGKRKTVIGFIIVIIITLTTAVLAAGSGTNQLPSGRISYRLDLHYGQVASNSPMIPLYSDAACTQPISHYLLPEDWVVAYFSGSGFTGAVTYPITVEQASGSSDYGLSYTTHYIPKSYFKYIVSGEGSFFGNNWNENGWYNKLPTTISYTSKLPGNGDTIWVGNNTDGGLPGGFQVLTEPSGNGYYRLWTGDWSDTIMSASPSKFCFYDLNHSDYINADYSWNLTAQRWTTAGLKQGQNLVSYAGMDASGNFDTSQRYINWDTIAPHMVTDLVGKLTAEGRSGWFNLVDLQGSEVYKIDSKDDTSATKDVSGLNTGSLITSLDGTIHFGNSDGYQSIVDDDGVYKMKPMSLAATMEAVGVQADGTGGQGTHTFQFSTMDHAGNVATISGSIKVDTIPPTCTVSVSASDWKQDGAPITLTYSDSLSGVASRQYSWSQSQTDAGTWQNYTPGQQLTPPDTGSWYLHWQSTDVAENSSSGVFGPYNDTSGLTVTIQTPNAAYLTDTDVITSAIVADGSSTPVLPSDSVTLKLTVTASDGSTYATQTKAVVVPSSNHNLIWFRWHTPSTAGTYTLTASAISPSVPAQSGWTSTLRWNISTPTESMPPDTALYDKQPSYFYYQSPASSGYASSLSWNEWIYSGGAFKKETYTANLSSALKITPEAGENGLNRIVTASEDPYGNWTMKAGYGINEAATGSVSVTSGTGSPIDANSTTLAQLTEGRYPEFNYWDEGYFRLFKNNGRGNFTLRPNKYSVLGLPVHYTPVWFPNGAYTALATMSQAWTPAGMLGSDATDTITISGATPQDWYVRVFQ